MDKMQGSLTENKETVGTRSVVVVEGRAGDQLCTCLIPEAD